MAMWMPIDFIDNDSNKPTCQGHHGLKAFRTPKTGFGCDRCTRRFQAGTVMFGCRICDYDFCCSCYPYNYEDLRPIYKNSYAQTNAQTIAYEQIVKQKHEEVKELKCKIENLESNLLKLKLEENDKKKPDDNNKKNDNVSNECEICFGYKKEYALITCGHVVCGQCASKLQKTTKKCPFCQQKISSTIKLYGIQ
eukprot:353744_1